MQHRLASDARKGETYYVSRGVCRKVEPHAGCGQHIERMAVKLVHVCRVAFGVFACLRAGTGEARDVYQVFCPRAEALLPAAVNDGREALGAYHSWCDAKCAHTLGTVYFMRTDAHKVGAEACRGEFDSHKALDRVAVSDNLGVFGVRHAEGAFNVVARASFVVYEHQRYHQCAAVKLALERSHVERAAARRYLHYLKALGGK